MSDDRDSQRPGFPVPPIPFRRPRRRRPSGRPRVRKRRLLAILSGLALIALVSTVFGMMMAVASDLPKLETRQEFRSARNSVLLDVQGKPLGILTANNNRIIVSEDEISPAIKHAIIAIEDRRFFQNPGIDVRGIARAFVQDVMSQGAVQGGSTITQQFVKNALDAQQNRTIFQKLREAALAYHLTRKWTKGKILTEYLNAIYFGNGAYGIESAARTYFGKAHPGCEKTGCARVLEPHEAALIAGVVASPTGYDPVLKIQEARKRRDLVLQRMLEQGYITRAEFVREKEYALPAGVDIEQPREKSEAPYFTTWVRQQVVDHFGAARAFQGGLKIRTTIDLEIQRKAEEVVRRHLGGPGLPSAALVAIDNRSGEVRAMVGGSDYTQRAFNLATQGQRQPGSAFKPFVLAAALQQGISPSSTWVSAKREFTVPNTRGREKFVVNNYEDNYAGVTTLARATTFSDNAVYAQVGIKVGTRRVARLARRMGIRTPVSRNYAITLGGLKQGVTVLDMAHAYETFAMSGRRIYGTLGSSEKGPVGIKEACVPRDRRFEGKCDGRRDRDIVRNEVRDERVLPAPVAKTTSSILSTVLTQGTARVAQLNQFAAGKTGTTEDYGDAWFVGYTDTMTVAVWVGHADQVRAMKTEFRGKPVAGGTFPALIWRDFLRETRAIYDGRLRARGIDPAGKKPQGTPAPTPATPPGTGTGTGTGTVPATPPAQQTQPQAPAPARPAPTEPEPEPPAPDDGGGTPPPDEFD